GYSVTTTIPSDLQTQAEQAVLKGLVAYDQRHGYRKPEQSALAESQWPEALAKARAITQFLPAVVTHIGTDSITVLLANGEQEPVSWQSMRWARPFINSRSMGPIPRKP